MKYSKIFLSLLFALAIAVSAIAKPRIWVSSDMNTDNDPDDKLTLALLLLHADQFDIRGITVKDPDWIREYIFSAYEKDYPGLQEKIGGFPAPSTLEVMEESTRNGAHWEQGFTEDKVFDLETYPTVQKMVEEARQGPIYLLNWGPMNEIAHAVKWLIDQEETATLDNITIISHSTRKEDNSWNYFGDPKAADYVLQMAQQGLVKFYELGASGNPMCRQGEGELDEKLMKSSYLGKVMGLKWQKNGPDFSDGVTFLVLLDYFGGLDRLSSDGDWDPDFTRRAKEALASINHEMERRAAAAASTREDHKISKTPPNIVIVMTDDQGYQDVGTYGAQGFETPHLDQLAAEGARFTRWYAAQPVCSASRAALLTGCYPNRIGIHKALNPQAKHGLHEAETTIAELLKQEGYATAAYGKWHLGHHPEFLPMRHGFDEFFGIPYSNDMWPFHPTYGDEFPPLPLIEGEETIAYLEDQTELTTQLTERAVGFIEKNADRPFFVYLAHPQPHVPLYVSDKFEGKTRRGLYGDVISEIDWSVGQIMDALERNGLTENTLILFTSDNGPWLSYGEHSGSANPLREGKLTTWEGGVRVPAIMRWPGKIPEGTVVEAPVMNIDLLPTLAEIVDTELPAFPIDGENIWPLILNEPGTLHPHEGYYFYFEQNELQAVMIGDWKLYFPHPYRTLSGRQGGRDGLPKPYDTVEAGLELYNVVDDPAETQNLVNVNRDALPRLKEFAEKARRELGDQLTQTEGSENREPGRLH